MGASGLAVWPGMDPALRSNGGRGMAGPAARRVRRTAQAPGPVRGTAGVQWLVGLAVFRLAARWLGIARHCPSLVALSPRPSWPSGESVGWTGCCSCLISRGSASPGCSISRFGNSTPTFWAADTPIRNIFIRTSLVLEAHPWLLSFTQIARISPCTRNRYSE